MTVAVIALIVALGGTSYAAFAVPKNSVGSRQLKNNAVTTKKIKNGSVTGAKVNLSTLGRVPSAITANTANSATNATNAAHATNADELGGSSPSAFHDRCPSGTTKLAADLCVTTADEGSLAGGHDTWDGAVHDCAALGMRLPSLSEALLLISVTNADVPYWTDDFYVGGSGTTPAAQAVYFAWDPVMSPRGDLFGDDSSSENHVRCVTTPVNS
jgi:hypothetical protein